MATLDAPPPVNLVRSIFLCNVFNFFFSASKACLLPFITVYLKMLGLSATQTGLIIGLKTVVSLVFAPLWARCAVRCGRRRCMLMFSLFVMAATYLSLSAVPSIDEHAFASRCHVNKVNSNFTIEKVTASFNKLNITTKTPVVKSTETHVSNGITQSPESHVDNSVTQSPGKTTEAFLGGQTGAGSTAWTSAAPSHTAEITNNRDSDESGVPVESITKSKSGDSVETTTKSTRTTKRLVRTTEPLEHTVSAEDQETIDILKLLLLTIGVPNKELNGASKVELENALEDILASKGGDDIVGEALAQLPDDVTTKLFKIISKEATSNFRRKREVENSEDISKAHVTTEAADDISSYFTWKNIYHKMKDIQKHMRDTENQIFIVVLMILMVGETFCSPVEKIADDGWFEFLETIDDLEKYGMQRIWSTFAYILLPVIVTIAVDHTSCVFGMSVHPFALHFYLFGIMVGITFLLSFIYPMATSDKFKYATKVAKGIRVVCCGGRAFMFVVTLLLLGIIYSSYYNFLFWHLLDMGSKEVTLGLCLTMAALSEIPMLLFSEKLVKKIGNGGVVLISLLLVAGRCIYYSFLPTPWAVIPAELTHAFTHTALWWAILSSSAFNTSPALSRSIRSILSTVYFGVGFAIGSMVSGVVYDVYGAAILFQASAVVAFAWFPFLCLGVRCCREKDKSDIKYTRLLATDDASDDTDSMEDDWLEQALKDK